MNYIQTVDEFVTVKENFIVILDSKNGKILNGPYNSAVEFQFQGNLNFNNDNHIQVTFGLNSFSCPNSIYIINENNYLLSMT